MSILSDSERLESVIERGWDEWGCTFDNAGNAELRQAVDQAMLALDQGKIRVAEKIGDSWVVHGWIKKAILLSFRLYPLRVQEGGPDASSWFDRLACKFRGWDREQFVTGGFRAVPSCVVRHGVYVAPEVVLMPCFINVGAYIGRASMVDTWATVGSCAQIGQRVHISGGVGIGGVLEPLQAQPVIIEDDCFIGARSEIAEGVIVQQGSVLAMGVYLGSSTKIIDRASGELYRGRVPPRSVVVPGCLPGPPLPDGSPGPGLYCAVIVKQVDSTTRAKTSINELLRDHCAFGDRLNDATSG